MKTEKQVKKLVNAAVAAEKANANMLAKTNTAVLGATGVGVLTLFALFKKREQKLLKKVSENQSQFLNDMRDDLLNTVSEMYGYDDYDEPYTADDEEEQQEQEQKQ